MEGKLWVLRWAFLPQGSCPGNACRFIIRLYSPGLCLRELGRDIVSYG